MKKFDKPAWLDRSFNVTATTNDENSLDRQYFVGHFRINHHALTAKQTLKINELRCKNCVIRFSDKPSFPARRAQQRMKINGLRYKNCVIRFSDKRHWIPDNSARGWREKGTGAFIPLPDSKMHILSVIPAKVSERNETPGGNCSGFYPLLFVFCFRIKGRANCPLNWKQVRVQVERRECRVEGWVWVPVANCSGYMNSGLIVWWKGLRGLIGLAIGSGWGR